MANLRPKVEAIIVFLHSVFVVKEPRRSDSSGESGFGIVIATVLFWSAILSSQM